MSFHLGNIVGASMSTEPAAVTPQPPAGPSQALLQKCAEAVTACDAAREATAKAEALKAELFAAMSAEKILTIPVPGRKQPVKIEMGKECRAPSQTILKAHLSQADAEKVWQATEKNYERLVMPKPDAIEEPSK